MPTILTGVGRSKTEKSINIQIIDKEAVSASSDTFNWVFGSCSIKWAGDSKNFTKRYIKSTFSLTMIVDNTGEDRSVEDWYKESLTAYEGRYIVRVTVDSELEFIGKIVADLGSVERHKLKSRLNIKAVDILSDIENLHMTVQPANIDAQYHNLFRQHLDDSEIWSEIESTEPVLSILNNFECVEERNDVDYETKDWNRLIRPNSRLLYRKKETKKNENPFEDHVESFIDYANVFNGRFYCAKGRVVFDQPYARLYNFPVYWEYIKSDGLGATGTKYDKQIGGQGDLFDVYRSVQNGAGVLLKDGGKYSALPASRKIILTKSGNGFRNLIQDIFVYHSNPGPHEFGSVLEFTDYKLILDLTLYAGIELLSGYDLNDYPAFEFAGAVDLSLNFEFTLEIKIGGKWLTNEGEDLFLNEQPGSAATLHNLNWSATQKFLVVKFQAAFTNLGQEFDIFGKLNNIIIAESPDLEEGGIGTIEITNVDLEYFDGTDFTLPAEAVILWNIANSSRMGLQKQLQLVYDEEDTALSIISNETRNRTDIEIETKLIDYDDAPNDPRALYRQDTGATDWKDKNLAYTGTIDELILVQMLTMTKNYQTLYTGEVLEDLRFSDLLRVKTLNGTYDAFVPLNLTWNIDRGRTSGTWANFHMTQETGSFEGDLVLDNSLDLPNFADVGGGNVGGGGFTSGSGAYPVIELFEDVTDNYIDVTIVTLPTTVTTLHKRMIAVFVGGLKYKLVNTLSVDPQDSRREVTTDVSGINNRLIFDKTMRSQDIEVIVYGEVTGITS